MELTIEQEIFCIGAVEVCPGLFFGLAQMPDEIQQRCMTFTMGWQFHYGRKLTTNVQPFIAIGHGLEVTYVPPEKHS